MHQNVRALTWINDPAAAVAWRKKIVLDASNFEMVSPGSLKSGALNSLFCDSP